MDFWQQLGGEPVPARVIQDHFRTFAYTILDRIFLFAGRNDQCQLRISGHELLWAYLDRGQGCVLIGAHLGSFEAARVAALERKDIPIRIIMDEKISEKLNSVLMKLNPSLNNAIVQLGSPTALFDVKTVIDGGGVVGMLADRVTAGEDTYQQNFLGRCATFPRAPLRLTAVLGAPVFFFTALFQTDKDGQPYYDVIFVPLSAALAPGEPRRQWIEALGRRYVTVLEQYCRRAPHNWFNFYDFWPDIATQEDLQSDTGATVDIPPVSGANNVSATAMDHGRPSHDS
ncbi:MAG: LpxL/LpxP family acyltransferase [Acidiferrobacter sp.]